MQHICGKVITVETKEKKAVIYPKISLYTVTPFSKKKKKE